MIRGEGRPELPGILLAALVLSVALLPPELNPSGLALASVLAAGTGFLLLFPTGGAPGIPREWAFTGSVASATLLLAVLSSSQSHRTLSVLLAAGISAVAFVAALRLPVRGRGRAWVLAALAGAGGTAAAWGLYQRLFSLPRTARQLRDLGQPVLDPEILRAESGRAFGGFLLPSCLGIFLAMTIPVTLRFGILHRWRGKGGMAAAGLLLLQAAGLMASVSYGAVASLAVACVVLFARLPAVRRRGRILLSAVLGAAAAGVLLMVLRWGEGMSPLLLRAGNWLAAWRIFLAEPLFGAGLGNFADAYPRVMSPGMNETAYAHNSYLQVAAEGGILALLWAAWGAVLLVRRLLEGRAWREQPTANLLLAAGPLAFLTHNLFDFSAYLPSLSITFAVAAGVAVGQAGEGGREERRSSGTWIRLPRAALVLLLLGGTTWALRASWSRSALDRGRDQVAAGRLADGKKLLREAARRDPSDPDPPAMLAEMDLTESAGKPFLMAEGARYARRSVELRPRRAYGHYVLALYRLAEGDRGGAWTELQRARELFPSRDLYIQEELRLRRSLLPAAGGGVETDVRR